MNPYIENYVKKQVAPLIVRSVESVMKKGNMSLKDACEFIGEKVENYEEAKKFVSENGETKEGNHNA